MKFIFWSKDRASREKLKNKSLLLFGISEAPPIFAFFEAKIEQAERNTK